MLVGVAKLLGGTIKLSEEHEEFAWLNREQALDYDLVSETRAAISILSKKISK